MPNPTATSLPVLSFTCLALFAYAASISPLSEAATPSASPNAGDTSATQCGFVSARQGVVPESDNIFSARITQIDGHSAPSVRTNRHQVAAGSHTLTISEAIDQNRLSTAQLTQIRKMKKFAHADAYKPLVVDVKPGVSYRIGARLHRDKLDTQNIKDNAYWEPVVWEEVAEACP